MTHVNISKFITIAAIFSAMGIGLGCLGASPATQTLSNAPALPHIVKFDAGATQLLPGDNITITDIHGTADTITPGNIYCIKGTYTLASHDKAMLAAFTTAKNANEGTTPYMQVQTLNISKGDASFTLYLPMAIQGWPHISFYSVGPGQNGSFSGVYFGTGDSLLKKWWGTHEATDTVGTAK